MATYDPSDEDLEEGGDIEEYGTGYQPESDEAGDLWCPNCFALMYADSVRCPKCGEYVTPGVKRRPGHLDWWLWGGMVLILAAIAAIVVAALLI